MYFQEILALFVAAIKIDNPTRKALVEAAVTSLGTVLDASQKVDAVLDEPGVSKGMISGLIELAQLFGNDRNLTDDQKAAIKSVGVKLVDLGEGNVATETAIEDLFFALVDGIDAFQELVADENLPTVA